MQALMRFTRLQVEQTKQLWAGYDSRMACLAGHRKHLLKLLEQQDARIHPLKVVLGTTLVLPDIDFKL